VRSHGTLVKWNDERGFGFIAVASGTAEVFVHVSSFPRDGQRPRIGEMLSFEIQTGDDGKSKALLVQRPGRPTRSPRPGRQPQAALPGWANAAGAVLLLAIAAVLVYARLGPSAAPTQAEEAAIQSLMAKPAFVCDNRTHCSQMTSCAEAEFFLKNCPGAQMDGNNDGEPCEEQW
jgi:cold shock CspA family protein